MYNFNYTYKHKKIAIFSRTIIAICIVYTIVIFLGYIKNTLSYSIVECKQQIESYYSAKIQLKGSLKMNIKNSQ